MVVVGVFVLVVDIVYDFVYFKMVDLLVYIIIIGYVVNGYFGGGVFEYLRI